MEKNLGLGFVICSISLQCRKNSFYQSLLEGMKKNLGSKIILIIFWDFLIFYQIFLWPQVKGSYLSLILQHSQNWLVPTEPQKYEKHKTDRTLTQRYVKKKYRRKNQFNFKKYNNTLQNTYYKLIEQKG